MRSNLQPQGDLKWQTLFEQYQSSQLSQRVFCERHSLSLSTFYAKRQQLQCFG
ncbi:IS66 family insertion sequence element accessory protein TnpA, partial [Vibrio ordalii]|uniref:IS66 family insertion sequence element accessory protein TnpA n=1 Tax=Vibrio ordalii TaxID=28174 RepID=UPI0039EC4F1D